MAYFANYILTIQVNFTPKTNLLAPSKSSCNKLGFWSHFD